MTRRVLLTGHTGREHVLELAKRAQTRLTEAGIEVCVFPDEADTLAPGATVIEAPTHAEVALVLGGDGTLLRAAEMCRPAGTPLLGINLGHIGFLAEADPDEFDVVLDRLIAKQWVVEERMTIDLTVTLHGEVLALCWALNEASLEKADRSRMVEVAIGVDGRPLVGFAADGIIIATPTGSTAYAFSAGGPVLWPDVEALLVVPAAAHALFARPLVLSPRSTVAIDVLPGESPAILSCDGRRSTEIPANARVEATGGATPVPLARIVATPFTDRLVGKFGLQTRGWRDQP